MKDVIRKIIFSYCSLYLILLSLKDILAIKIQKNGYRLNL